MNRTITGIKSLRIATLLESMPAAIEILHRSFVSDAMRADYEALIQARAVKLV